MTPAELSATIAASVRGAVEAGELAAEAPERAVVERPKNPEHGDYATPVAMRLAKAAGRPPRELAEALAVRLRTTHGIQRVDVAGPGFLNITLAQAALGEIARTVVTDGDGYGRTHTTETDSRINLEFVSANPTGPVHIGGVRWAAVGDALARILTAAGARVTKEYYFNDAGSQIDRFAASLDAAARDRPTPPDGYGGAYVADIARAVVAANPGLLDEPEEKVLEVFRRDGVAAMFDEITASLHDFGVDFDVFFSERALHEAGDVTRAVQRLREHGHVYTAEGAVWLRTTDFGDDKDRVLVKSDGSTTYFTADAAYYLDKRERGFDRCLYLLGADHHGYVGRLHAMAACFGDDPEATLEVLVGQLVNLVREGRPVRMSKRAGTVVTLTDLVEAVGVDAARYALARASVDSTLDLDLDLLVRRAAENPVFYVQYAATRAASILRNAVEMGITTREPTDVEGIDPGLLSHPREADLLAALGEFPRVVTTAAELREPHRIARYLEEQVARAAQRFFDECRVLPRGDEPITELTHARLLLWRATRVVLSNGLHLLGVTAPERM